MMPSSNSLRWPYTTQLNFMAIVDTLIPSSVGIFNSGWRLQYGGVELSIWEYLLMSFDNLPTPLSNEVSQLLDLSALYTKKEHYHSPFFIYNPHLCKGIFSKLSRKDRLTAITRLDNLKIPLDILPIPYKNNPALLQITIDSLYQLTVFGYYSEWYGYGYTRYNPPSFRYLCTYPVTWSYTGYPGPSFAYRDFRGFLLNKSNLKSE
ncbi:hypothetical protein BN982_02360 [Halobacillus karajensis]|uniref:Gluconate 2-dehydrogenase subunit 3 n=1 Tax=Halobacillus karajensis TaxID=195088 RepID=A0A024P8P3_9BACI|nr:hypothetical protein BN982_02360 [Halobacillus karajensis]CDQ25290.1 hypothetical protein BN983_03605 [Halobacillus karajensis]CDQ28349.1 hypothetical protein BN981_02647 [Halobacillus karajensis]